MIDTSFESRFGTVRSSAHHLLSHSAERESSRSAFKDAILDSYTQNPELHQEVVLPYIRGLFNTHQNTASRDFGIMAHTNGDDLTCFKIFPHMCIQAMLTPKMFQRFRSIPYGDWRPGYMFLIGPEWSKNRYRKKALPYLQRLYGLTMSHVTDSTQWKHMWRSSGEIETNHLVFEYSHVDKNALQQIISTQHYANLSAVSFNSCFLHPNILSMAFNNLDMMPKGWHFHSCLNDDFPWMEFFRTPIIEALEKLSLQAVSMPEEVVSALTTSIVNANRRNLESLSIRNCKLGLLETKVLLGHLDSQSRLTHLDLSQNPLTTSVFVNSRLPTSMRHLSLELTEIDGGFFALIGELCPGLIRLDLSSKRISNASVLQMLQVHGVHSLRQLNLNGPNIDVESLQVDVRPIFPQLQVSRLSNPNSGLGER